MNAPRIARVKRAGGDIRSRWAWGLVAFLALAACVAAANGEWLTHVPDSYRQKKNPFAGRPEAIAGGSRVFADHCAKCHGPDALGRDDHPSLRSDRVQNAADGEIFWLLKNGNLAKGMPSWSDLPEPTRWQVIAYVKSLGPAAAASAPDEKGQPQ
jgi:mono/diheme cytochrome c family protein